MSKMTPISPLQLKAYAFTAISVRVIPDGQSDNEPTLTHKINFENDQASPNEWRLMIYINVSSAKIDKPFIYDIEVAVQGLVEVNSNFPKEKREHLAVVNGMGLLYSATREMVVNLTSRSAHGPLNLPILNFVEIVGNSQDPKVKPTKGK